MNDKDNFEPMKIQFEKYLVEKKAKNETQVTTDCTCDPQPKNDGRTSPIAPLVVKSYIGKITKNPKNQDDIKLKMKYYIRRLKIARKQTANKK